jgi:hypothetical protein
MCAKNWRNILQRISLYREYLSSIVQKHTFLSMVGVLLLSAGAAHPITMPGLNPDAARKAAIAESCAGDNSEFGSAMIEGCSYVSSGDDDPLLKSEDVITPKETAGDLDLGSMIASTIAVGSNVDLYRSIDSSLGKYVGEFATSFSSTFEGSQVPAPEPKTMFLVGVALIALSLMGDKRRSMK